MPGMSEEEHDKATKVLGDQRVGVNVPSGEPARTYIIGDEIEQIPVSSDFYRVREMSRNVVPERHNDLFVTEFNLAVGHRTRDYRNLINRVMVATKERGYEIRFHGDTYATLSKLYASIARARAYHPRKLELTTYHFIDIIVAAIRHCPVTDKNIFI